MGSESSDGPEPSGRYIVYGAGAIGATIAARLHEAGRDVSLIARGEHLRALQRDGLLFRDPERSVRLTLAAYADPAGADPQAGDVVVLAMKSQATEPALRELVQVDAAAELIVVCAQNAVENERLALRLFPLVYGMFVYLSAEHLAPGEVRAFATPCPGVLDVGRFPVGTDGACEAIAADLRAASFASRAMADIMRWKYAKLLMNLANATGAIFGPGEEADRLADAAREEALRCFAAAGIDYAGPEEARDRLDAVSPMGLVDGQPFSGSSTHQSLRRGTGDVESDYLNGEISLLGRLHGVRTPLNDELTRVVRVMARDGRAPGDGAACSERLLALGYA
jgi:2-dehydropantoate 2-reductase